MDVRTTIEIVGGLVGAAFIFLATRGVDALLKLRKDSREGLSQNRKDNMESETAEFNRAVKGYEYLVSNIGEELRKVQVELAAERKDRLDCEKRCAGYEARFLRVEKQIENTQTAMTELTNTK